MAFTANLPTVLLNKVAKLDSTGDQQAAHAMAASTSDNPHAAFVNNMSQWSTAFQEYYKNTPFGTAMGSYPGIWGSAQFPLYSSFPFYNPGMNPYPMVMPPATAMPDMSMMGTPVASSMAPAAAVPAMMQPMKPPTQPEPPKVPEMPKAPPENPMTAEVVKATPEQHATNTIPVEQPQSLHTPAPQQLESNQAIEKSTSKKAKQAVTVDSDSEYDTSADVNKQRHGGNAWPTTPGADGMMLDERELKRQRRKQSNRESARRSRLRKQAETEQLSKTVTDIQTENVVLKKSLTDARALINKLMVEKSRLADQVRSLGGIPIANIEPAAAPPAVAEALQAQAVPTAQQTALVLAAGSAGPQPPQSTAALHADLDPSAPQTEPNPAAAQAQLSNGSAMQSLLSELSSIATAPSTSGAPPIGDIGQNPFSPESAPPAESAVTIKQEENGQVRSLLMHEAKALEGAVTAVEPSRHEAAPEVVLDVLEPVVGDGSLQVSLMVQSGDGKDADADVLAALADTDVLTALDTAGVPMQLS